MKKYKFFIAVPRVNVNYALDVIKEHRIQILKKNLRILTNPYIGFGYIIQIYTTQNDFERLLNDFIGM